MNKPCQVVLVSLLTLFLAACAPSTQPARPNATAQRLCADPERPADIADPVLRAELQRALRVEVVTCGILVNSSRLELNEGRQGKRVASLQGLQGAVNLRTLDMDGHAVSDLAPIGDLESLVVVSLNGSDISDLGPLEGLATLQWLELSDNDISDLSPLSSLTSLTNLDLSRNQVDDIGALAPLTELTSLELSGNQIETIDAVSGMRELGRLSLDGNRIRDLRPLIGLPELRLVDLSDNNISDIEPLLFNFDLRRGAHIDVSNNCLDLDAGSHDMRNIEDLEGRGVNVIYEPQMECEK